MSETAADRRVHLLSLLGDLPDRDRPLTAETVSLVEHDGYLLETLTLDLNGIEPVPAYYVRPVEVAGAVPVVLYHHAHGGDYVLGKDELIRGRSALQDPPWARVLTDRGFAALCIDTWAFGERRGRSEGEIFRQMLWDGQVMWGMMVFDALRSIDYLVSRPDVDSNRIATLGLSMGSTLAWWAAALDERIAACVDLCCLTDFDALEAIGNLEGHGVYYYVPRLRQQFTAARINALIAPRPHLALAGRYDRLTPLVGLERIDQEMRTVYADLDAADAWRLETYPCGHLETAAMRASALDWLERWCQR
jgi:hypothetical protein